MAALYLHVPFRAPPQSSTESAFVAAVEQEITRTARPPFTDATIRSLYVGGGRPSLLSRSALRTLLKALRESFSFPETQEVTLEIHPVDASPSVLDILLDLGVTRLSLDARSFVDEELRSLGTSYSVEDLRRILDTARALGVKRLSVDLAFGGTEQSLATWKTSLHRTVALQVPHVALHERTSPPSAPPQEDRADRFAFAMTFMDAKGYDQYELTHFARPGHRSRYQTHVYAHGNVLGLGPGAESFWWPNRSADAAARRWSNVADLGAYLERMHTGASPVEEREPLDRPALAREHILLRLRTSDGLDLHRLARRYGCSLRNHRDTTLNRLATEGLVSDDSDCVRLTPRGRLLADAITQRLIRDG